MGWWTWVWTTPSAASSHPWSAAPSPHQKLGSSTTKEGPIHLKSLKAKVITTEETCRASSYRASRDNWKSTEFTDAVSWSRCWFHVRAHTEKTTATAKICALFYMTVAVVQLLSRVWCCVPTDCSMSGLSATLSLGVCSSSCPESVMPSNHLFLCCPLLLEPPIFPSIGVVSNEFYECYDNNKKLLRLWLPFSIIPSVERPFPMGVISTTGLRAHRPPGVESGLTSLPPPTAAGEL